MPADTTVKFLHSAMPGAPTLSGTAGALVTLLDACLVNGFGLVTLDSLTIAGGVATMTRAAGHSFEAGTVALVAGATVTGGTVNGEQRVLAVTSTTATFDATGLANQTATGTITAKVAGLGWTKPYSSGNVAAFQSPNVASTQCLVRVDDSAAVLARLIGYESMTDINTGTGPFPTTAQLSGGVFWTKSNAASAATRPWVLVGDDRGWYVSLATTNSTMNSTHGFGDFLSNKSPDAYACALSGANADLSGTNPTPGSSNQNDIASTGTTLATMYAPRGVSGLGGAVALRRTNADPVGATQGFSGASSSFMPYPNPADNGLYVTPFFLSEGSAPSASYRGRYAGLLFCPQNVGVAVFAQKDPVTDVSGLPGKTLRTLLNNTGPMFVDVTGPWR